MTPYLEHPDRVHMVAVCDMVEPLAQAYAKDAGVDTVYTDLDDMLRNADIDAVDICTGHAQHAPNTIAAAEAGKHVLVEKAMSNTLQGCRDMVAAADKAGVTLMVSQQLRYSADATAVKALVDKGKLGDIQGVRNHIIMQGPDKSWMNDGSLGGGVLLLNSIHHIDLLRYYVGNVKRVMAFCKAFQPQMVNGGEDLFTATLEFENGAIGDIFASWTSYLTPEHASYLLLGSEGTIHSGPYIGDGPRSPFAHFGTMMAAYKEELDPSNESDRRRRIHPEFEPIDTSWTNMPSYNYFVNEVLHFEECVQDRQRTDHQRPGQHRIDEGCLRHFRVVPDGQGRRSGCSLAGLVPGPQHSWPSIEKDVRARVQEPEGRPSSQRLPSTGGRKRSA